VTSNGNINRVFGGLLGQYSGNKCEVFSSFEFYNQSGDDSKINLDLNYIEERKKLTDQLYPNYELVGFFMTISREIENKNNNSLSNLEELLKAMDYFGVVSPLLLTLCTDLSTSEELPVSVYSLDRIQNRQIKLDHIIEGYESERITLDTVTKSTDFQNNESAMIQNMITMSNALEVLQSNLKLIRNSINQEKFKNDPQFNLLLDELIRNYPNVSNPELVELINSKELEIMMLNNICADSINVGLSSRVGNFGEVNVEKKRGNNLNFQGFY